MAHSFSCNYGRPTISFITETRFTQILFTKTLKTPILNPSICNNKSSRTKMEMAAVTTKTDQISPLNNATNDSSSSVPQMSKNAQKKLKRQERFEAKKAEKKAALKEMKKKEGERKRKEWEEKLASVDEEKRSSIIETRKATRKERMEKKSQEREMKIEKLMKANEVGQNIVVDLEFSHLMATNEIHSLVQQIMYCYAINGRCNSPSHLWLTGCNGEIETQLKKIPGFDKWIIEKKSVSYIEALKDQKDKLVYLTADSEVMLEELDSTNIYIIGGLVDRNRWKGITMNKANEQGIQTAKLPIGNYLKMSSSQVLTVNQVIEILLKYLETKDWKASFFHVIPQRKRCEDENGQEHDQSENKKLCTELLSSS